MKPVDIVFLFFVCLLSFVAIAMISNNRERLDAIDTNAESIEKLDCIKEVSRTREMLPKEYFDKIDNCLNP